LIDHLVLNHKQLLSVERDNHKARIHTCIVHSHFFLFYFLNICLYYEATFCLLFSLTQMQVLQSRGELHEDAQARYDEARKCG
jgi:hypothetical protein